MQPSAHICACFNKKQKIRNKKGKEKKEKQNEQAQMCAEGCKEDSFTHFFCSIKFEN